MIIVGVVAAIRPLTYDMTKTYYKDVMCGTLKLPSEIIRTRLVDMTDLCVGWSRTLFFRILFHPLRKELFSGRVKQERRGVYSRRLGGAALSVNITLHKESG